MLPNDEDDKDVDHVPDDLLNDVPDDAPDDVAGDVPDDVTDDVPDDAPPLAAHSEAEKQTPDLDPEVVQASFGKLTW